MVLRIVALLVILIGASIAWGILGTTLFVRTQQSDQAQRASLGSLWGPEQTQQAPVFSYSTKLADFNIPIDASRIAVDLGLDQRRKGLLWYNTYRVDFAAAYRIVNPGKTNRITFSLRFPADKG